MVINEEKPAPDYLSKLFTEDNQGQYNKVKEFT